MRSSFSLQHLLVVILVLFACGMTVTFIYASRHVSKVTDRDYYVHGLNYAHDSQGNAAGVALGWDISPSVSNGFLHITVSDKNAHPVTAGKAYLLPEGATLKLPFTEQSPGVFRLPLNPALTKGVITFSTSTASITKRVVIVP